MACSKKDLKPLPSARGTGKAAVRGGLMEIFLMGTVLCPDTAMSECHFRANWNTNLSPGVM